MAFLKNLWNFIPLKFITYKALLLIFNINQMSHTKTELDT